MVAHFSPRELTQSRLDDRYAQLSGRVFMTGTQALLRVVLDQARRDRERGRNIGGFISGYRGSPLAGVDLEIWRNKKRFSESKIEFLPAVNEDLAATAVLGTQQVESDPNREVDGVFALWYGKGPGVDRAGDALKHGNAYGSSPNGGVLVVAGDDHGSISSSMSHQSEVAFMAWFMPVLNPASVSEYLAFGEYGYALSRYSGMWVGFKAISETVESACSFELLPDRQFNEPDFTVPLTGLHYRWPDHPGPQIEDRMVAKKEAVLAFAEANPIDRRIYDVDQARFGIITTGKAHLDLMEALRLLGLGERECRKLGIDIYKVGLSWPLPRTSALSFIEGKEEVLVVEEKRGIIESQLKEYFYDWQGDKPSRIIGKTDEAGKNLVPWTGELSPRKLVPIIAARLDMLFPGNGFVELASKLTSPATRINVPGASRTPYFCSGCPHNTSTKVPEGSQALAGIGCHFMASWMDRETTSLVQMGGEGVNWAASSLFTGKNHVFQNLGEGTYYHSGSLAIRQAVAANANITYKILYNDAVAMTGGQPVDGPVSVQAIAQEVRAEGVDRIALVSDDPVKFNASEFPPGLTIHHRRELDAVQRELRDIKGVTILIYEQTCATEKRRRRKRGKMEDPKKVVYINDLVCEGCGDCSVESNCLSVEPKDTPLGVKRQINQSSCNKDFSCVEGFCPSFVTLEGAVRKKKAASELDYAGLAASVPAPEISRLEKPYDLLITGVGGTGVVTIGALVTMAAHLEGLGSSVLDFTGMAQKFGPVQSFVRLAPTPDLINQVRIDEGSADALIGCDIVVSSSPKASSVYKPGMRAAINTAKMPTGDIVRRPDADLAVGARLGALRKLLGEDSFATLDANSLAESLLGDAVFANVMMLGFAWQMGLVPVSEAALRQAIQLNGVAIELNQRAFLIGRVAAAMPEKLEGGAPSGEPVHETLDQIIERRVKFLTDYQNRAYGARYEAFVGRVRDAERGHSSEKLSEAVARSLFKLMAYKDEYEVARLHTQTGFEQRLKDEFDGDFRIVHHLAPPFMGGEKDARGRPRKRAFGQWIRVPFQVLARLKGLRGTPLDPFGYTAERKMERGLIPWFESVVERSMTMLTADRHDKICALLAKPMQIRGYGPVKEAAAHKVRLEVEAELQRLPRV